MFSERLASSKTSGSVFFNPQFQRLFGLVVAAQVLRVDMPERVSDLTVGFLCILPRHIRQVVDLSVWNVICLTSKLDRLTKGFYDRISLCQLAGISGSRVDAFPPRRNRGRVRDTAHVRRQYPFGWSLAGR